MGCSPATPVSSRPECIYRRAPGILGGSNFGACVRASHFCSGPPPPATQALSFCFRSSPVRGQCPLGETGIPGGPHACLWQRKSSVEGGLCVQVEGLETTATSHNNPLREGPGGPCGVPLSYPPRGPAGRSWGLGLLGEPWTLSTGQSTSLSPHLAVGQGPCLARLGRWARVGPLTPRAATGHPHPQWGHWQGEMPLKGSGCMVDGAPQAGKGVKPPPREPQVTPALMARTPGPKPQDLVGLLHRLES